MQGTSSKPLDICVHMIAVEDRGCNGSYIHIHPKLWSIIPYPDQEDSNVIAFNYCPLCGIDLTEIKEKIKVLR